MSLARYGNQMLTVRPKDWSSGRMRTTTVTHYRNEGQRRPGWTRDLHDWTAGKGLSHSLDTAGAGFSFDVVSRVTVIEIAGSLMNSTTFPPLIAVHGEGWMRVSTTAWRRMPASLNFSSFQTAYLFIHHNHYYLLFITTKRYSSICT